MRSDTAERRPFVFVSLVVLVILGIQFASTFKLLCPLPGLAERLNLPNIACDPAAYPFMQYPMYAGAYHEGDLVHQYVAIGEDASGIERRLEPEAIGFSFWELQPLVEALLANDRPAVEPFAALFEEEQEIDLVALRLEDQPWEITAAGPLARDQVVVARMSLGEAE